MRLSHIDFVPLLAIMVGGVLGASLSFGFLGSRSGEVPGVTLGLLYESSTTKESARRLEDLQRLLESNDRTQEVRRLLERDRMERVETARDPLRARFLEEYRRLALDRMEQVKTDVEKLQEEGWDVTFRPPVFRLPEIQQLTRER